VALLLLAAICAFSPRISLESRARRLRLKSRVATIEESRKGIGIEGERSRVNGVGVGAGGVGGENGGISYTLNFVAEATPLTLHPTP